MAAPKTIKNLAGDTPSAARLSITPPAIPPDPGTLEQLILQLQNTVNELIDRFNAHAHTENTNATYAQNATTSTPSTPVTGAGRPATNLFTAS